MKAENFNHERKQEKTIYIIPYIYKLYTHMPHAMGSTPLTGRQRNTLHQDQLHSAPSASGSVSRNMIVRERMRGVVHFSRENSKLVKSVFTSHPPTSD